MARAAPAEVRAIVPDNIKISDMPQFNRDDKKIAFPAWRMQCTERMLASSNIPIERHSTFILGALSGGSLEEIDPSLFRPAWTSSRHQPSQLMGNSLKNLHSCLVPESARPAKGPRRWWTRELDTMLCLLWQSNLSWCPQNQHGKPSRASSCAVHRPI